MLFRNLLLIAGALAILLGASIAGVLVLSPKPALHAPAVSGLVVLVAAKALPSGAVLQDTDLSWKALDSRTAPPGSLSRGQVSATQFVGSVTRRDLTAGEVVTRDDIFDRRDAKMLAAVLAPGFRAVTIDVDSAQGGAGLILPDDRVDVILVSQPGGMSAGTGNPVGSSRAVTLLRDVRVVAVDKTIARPTDPDAQSDTKSSDLGSTGPKTIALEVSDPDAERLLLGAQAGKIELALRSLARRPEAVEGAAVSTGDVNSAAATRSTRPLESFGRRVSGAVRSGLPRETSRPGSGAPIIIIRGSKAAAA